MDGLSNTNGSREGLFLASPKGNIIQYALYFKFSFTNSNIEYKALIVGLRISKKLDVQYLKAYSDLQLIIGHVQNEYKVREKNMKKFLSKMRDLIQAFHNFDIQ